MALNRRSMIGQTALAAVVASGSLLGAFSAAAQDVRGSPQCAPIKDGVKAIQCEIGQLDKRIDAANKRADEADRIGAAAAAVTECVKWLTAGVRSGAISKEEVLQKAGGKVTDKNACTIAKAYGFGPKAEATLPPSP